MKLTPFHDRTSRLNRTQMWFNWDRHIVPDAYRDLASELRATRKRVSMGDMSPLSKYEIRGPDAPRFIDRARDEEHDLARARPSRLHPLDGRARQDRW